MNVVGRAMPDELGMWLELISMLSAEDSIDLVLNDRLVLHIIVYAKKCGIQVKPKLPEEGAKIRN